MIETNQKMTTTSNEPNMAIYVYPNKEKHDSIAQTARDALSSFLSSIIDQDVISGYELRLKKTHPNLDTLRGKDKMLSKWMNEEDDKVDEDGVHLLVCSNFGGGKAEPSVDAPDSGWRDSRSCVMGWNENNEDFSENVAIHEVLHIFINEKNSDVSDMTVDGEHDLGALRTGYNDKTPLATGSVIGGARGECSGGGDHVNGYTKTLTQCSKDAIQYTLEGI